MNSDGAANSFSFGGTGKISGNGTLTKSGTSTLTISTANDYTGGTTISAGTVIGLDTNSVSGSTSALGNGPVTIASAPCCNLAMARQAPGRLLDRRSPTMAR